MLEAGEALVRRDRQGRDRWRDSALPGRLLLNSIAERTANSPERLLPLVLK